VEVALTGADRPSHLLHDTFGADEVPTESALAALRAGFESDGGKLLVRRDDSLETVHLRVDVPSCPAPELRTHSGALEVLVIEDDAALGDLYEDLLRSVGHAVTACRGLVSAREALQRQRFDAVVAEFQLRDGHLSELAAEVVADHPELPARTLVVTRDPRHPRLLEWVGSTRRPVLGKPFDVHELFAQVQALGA
jgi:CheY-like chemotaxis protein